VRSSPHSVMQSTFSDYSPHSVAHWPAHPSHPAMVPAVVLSASCTCICICSVAHWPAHPSHPAVVRPALCVACAQPLDEVRPAWEQRTTAATWHNGRKCEARLLPHGERHLVGRQRAGSNFVGAQAAEANVTCHRDAEGGEQLSSRTLRHCRRAVIRSAGEVGLSQPHTLSALALLDGPAAHIVVPREETEQLAVQIGASLESGDGCITTSAERARRWQWRRSRCWWYSRLW